MHIFWWKHVKSLVRAAAIVYEEYARFLYSTLARCQHLRKLNRKFEKKELEALKMV